MGFNLSFRLKTLPDIDKYTNKNNKKKGDLHPQIGPLSTVVIVLPFMICISPELEDKSEHAAVDRVLGNPFKFAVNKNPSCVSHQAVPHLRSNKYKLT
jgi:hypothetical protein